MVSRRHGAGRFPGVAMNQYLISIYQPDGPPPASIEIHRIMLEVHALRDEMTQAGAWVFSGGLHDASTAPPPRHTRDRTPAAADAYDGGKPHQHGLTRRPAADL